MNSEAVAVLGPVDVETAIALWPQPTVTATFADTAAATGTLTVTVALPVGADTRGETFDLTGASLDCGNAHLSLSQTGFAPGRPLTFDGVPRTVYNSASTPCTVTAALAQNSDTALNPPLYGAGNSASATSAPVAIDVPTLATSAGDFSAAWVAGTAPGSPQIAVTYTGSDPTLVAYAHDWSLTAGTAANPSCGSSSTSPASAPSTINASASCVTAGADWNVTVAFTYFGATANYSIAVTGTKPVPVDPSALQFAAVWAKGSKSGDAHVQVQYTGPYDDATLSSLNWTITVTASGSPGTTCGSSHAPPQADGTGPNVSVDLSACPATSAAGVSTFTVQLDFTDPNYGSSGTYSITVSGAAPK